MKRWIESILLVLAFCMAFVTSHAAAIDKPRVQDDAKFFSPDTVKSADALIAKIKSTHGRDVYVETWPGVPDDQRAKLKEKGEDDYFAEAVFRRANALKMTDGIIIVVCRDPSYLRIAVGPELKQLEFVTTDRDKLRTLMLDKFRGKKFDEGLLDGLKLIDATLKEGPARLATRQREQAAERAAAAASGRASNAAGTATAGAMAPASTEPYDPNHPVPEMPGPDRSHLFTGRNLVLVGVGIFVLYLLLRAVMSGMRRSQPTMAYGPPAGGMGAGGMGAGGMGSGGGGGVGRGFVGGLLGGAVGAAAYDHLSRGGEGARGNIGSHSETYIPPQMNPGGGATGAPPSGGDAFDLPRETGADGGGFESSGGSFGDDASSDNSGTSDAGGGFDSSGGSFDSGGGDAGGGDGGGGDF